MSTIAKSDDDKKEIAVLLKKSTPSYRQAYSDRTAWLMACLSELAYIRFNPLFSDAEVEKYVRKNVEQLIDKNRQELLWKLAGSVVYDADEERKMLESELDILNMSLSATFDKDGTQAILISNDKFIVLAFRGTEATSIKDIKADAKASITQCETGGKIHSGFKEAYEKVAVAIQEKLNEDEFKEKPLFITGHSLGGALATIATKELLHQGGIAACYTFGAPRVGDSAWVSGIKTAVYRVVNAADCVTMLPPGAGAMIIICGLSAHIPCVGEAVRSWLSKLGGYLHGGDMRYLTHCDSGQYEDVNLLFHTSGFLRFWGWLVKQAPWKKFLADHSISIYRKKLMVIAEKRNGLR